MPSPAARVSAIRFNANAFAQFVSAPWMRDWMTAVLPPAKSFGNILR
ncbi:hypothetical protein GHK80_00480 [Sinorhizobium medicae]|nr:hypothetical protein [Sinorhizobium medicae]